ncbi:hypothetical protein [Ideonella sp. YS5]|uniref:hypothetical protein n=1 Tax=Ideonella sp. YS5 TaxID=3453714 RepID=UPI003EEBE05A
MTKISRKQFLGALGSGTVVLWLQACGGGGSGYGSGGGNGGGSGGGLSCGASGASIANNHGHTLTIDETDLNSTTDKTYSIMGTAGHNHTVTFTVAQLGMLKNGQSVTVTSSTDSGHNHDVTAKCV